MKKILYSICVFSFAIFFSGCNSFFNPDSDDVLQEKNYVGDYTELYSGFMGIAGAVQTVADKGMFLEGLRGDLFEPTNNASREVWDVYNYSDDLKGNTLADPKGYYNVILNCNDYIKHVFAYRKVNPTALTSETYDGLIGGALRYKAWAYLMLAKIYGEAIYLDNPLTSYQDLSKYPTLGFDAIIEKCRSLIVDGVDGVNGKGVIRWSTELFPGQADSPTNLQWNRICPTPECLLAEIYLYQNKYQEAHDNCVSLIRQGGEEASYQLNLSEYNGEWKLFGRQFCRMEHITVAFFDYSLNQTNHVIDYLSNTTPNSYILRPTAAAMNRFNSQITSGGLLGDQYRGNGVTFKQVNNEWVMEKFLSGNETSSTIYRNDVQISLYRAAQIHLFLVESLIGLGRFQEALAFLNDGVGSYYNATDGKFLPPFEEYPTSLYVTSSASNKANRGIRGRVDLSRVGESVLKTPNADINKDKMMLDSLIVEETSLEMAGEASAYYTMIRMAKRWGDGTRKVWADKVVSKYPNGGSTIKTKLESNIDNWFIKYSLK
jgi:starch-binding outer membrane protein, SusD/RagB family